MPVRLHSRVVALRRTGELFLVETDGHTFQSRQVVVATGPFATPFVPAVAGGLSDTVVQLHSARYRNPDDLPGGRVLVVGGGNSGMQIAAELAQTRPVELAIGTRSPTLPQRLWGRDLFWSKQHGWSSSRSDQRRSEPCQRRRRRQASAVPVKRP